MCVLRGAGVSAPTLLLLSGAYTVSRVQICVYEDDPNADIPVKVADVLARMVTAGPAQVHQSGRNSAG